MDQPAKCTLCFEIYGGEVRPRFLPCGHSFCTECLQQLIINGILPCPRCQSNHQVSNAATLTINYDLESMISSDDKVHFDKIAEKVSPIKGKAMAKIFKDQNSSGKNLLISAEKMKMQLGDYDNYLLENIRGNKEIAEKMQSLATKHATVSKHMDKERTMLVKMQAEGGVCSEKLKDSLKDLESTYATGESISVALAKVSESCGGMAKWIDECQQMSPDVQIASSVKDSRKELQCLSLESSKAQREEENMPSLASSNDEPTILGKMILQVQDHLITGSRMKHWHNFSQIVSSNQLFAVDTKNGCQRSAAISLQGDKLHLHSFKDTQVEPTHYKIEFADVINCLNKTTILAFLDISSGGSCLGRIYLDLSPDTPMARQFWMLCTGEFGSTYAGTSLFRGGHQQQYTSGYRYDGLPQYSYRTIEDTFIKGGENLSKNEESQALVKGINVDDPIYSRLYKEGVVKATSRDHPDQWAQFTINIAPDADHQEHNIFGKVQDGIHVLNIIPANSETQITDCGVVLSL